MSKDISLRFVFANYDGVSVTVPTTMNTRVGAIKETLILSWRVLAKYPTRRRELEGQTRRASRRQALPCWWR